jgi:hypothetical protein
LRYDGVAFTTADFWGVIPIFVVVCRKIGELGLLCIYQAFWLRLMIDGERFSFHLEQRTQQFQRNWRAAR